MSNQESVVQVAKNERRKNWGDRRSGDERRNPERLRHMDGECRNGIPRRSSDIAGNLVEGELWWSGDRRFF